MKLLSGATVFVALTACGGTSTPTTQPTQPGVSATPEPASKPGTLIQPGKVSGPPEPGTSMSADACSAKTDGGAIIDGCMTAEIKCGETITGHTRGGANRFNTRFYEKNFCTPATTDHNSGDERIYLLRLPEERTRAIVYLDTPCANLDLAAFSVPQGDGTCPNADTPVDRCEMNVKPMRTREKVDLFATHAMDWWIVVEGQQEQEGAFGLTVQCEKW